MTRRNVDIARLHSTLAAVDWLARKLYPRARPYERRSRMQMFYLMVAIVVLAAVALAAMLWFLNEPMRK